MNAKVATVGMAISFLMGIGANAAVADASRLEGWQPMTIAGSPKGESTLSAASSEAMDMPLMAPMHRRMSRSGVAAMHETMASEGMDTMHAAAREQMPAGLRDQCDQMHAAMVGGDDGASAPASDIGGHAGHHL